MESKRSGECVYCGRLGPITSDHVPPKCLFPPETRQNLITVAACAQCNGSFKLDDENFRLMLAIRADLPPGATAEYLRQSSMRGLAKPQASRLRASIRKRLGKASVRTPAGIYLGEAPTISVDFKRLHATAIRIITGLFAHFFGRRLPDSHLVDINFADLQRDSSAIQDPAAQELLALIGQQGVRHQASDVLEVWVRPAEDDANSSAWYVRILQTFGFLAFTIPKGDDGPAEPKEPAIDAPARR